LKTLVDLYDALSLARREIERIKDAVLPALYSASETEVNGEPPLPLDHVRPDTPWWRRWLAGSSDQGAWRKEIEKTLASWRAHADQARETQRRAWNQALGQVRQALDSLFTGYAMGLQRVERALAQHGLEPIATVGQAFDPEEMEVIEAVPDSGAAAGNVLDEVRRGYLWNGRVFRYAQVRVAR
jgi:hypothetical protein